ncbi:hypothetical protein D3C76_1264500 [compost metagenome]
MIVVNAAMEDISRWLTVSKQARNKGVATALLNHILQNVDTPSEINVTTFGKELPEGQPARKLNQKFGFVPLQDVVPDGPKGSSRQTFKLTIAPKVSL